MDWAPADIAECITDLPEEEQAVVFRLLPHAQATDVLEYLDAGCAAVGAESDGQRGGGAHPQRHVAGRPHGAARGAAGRRRGAAAPAALAGGKGDRAVAAELSRGQRRPADDARFHQRARRMDDPAGARSHPRARQRLGDAERDLRDRRARPADRRRAHPRIPARAR